MSIVKDFMHTCKEYYGITLPKDIATKILSNDNELKEEIKLGIDTCVREEIGQSLVQYILIDRDIEMKLCDKFSPEEGWHFPYNGSDEEYDFQFWTTFLCHADSLGFKVKLPEGEYNPRGK